jgi:hypothetical protein
MGGCHQCLDFIYAQKLTDKGGREVTGEERKGDKCHYKCDKTAVGCGKAQNQHYISM